MQLRFLATSPYVRKVMVAAIETRQDGWIEKIPTSPQADEADLATQNPLSKIPVLTLDDGTVLYDSRVICQYLDSRHDGPRLFPETAPACWTALRRQALGDGMMDAATLRRYEGLRPAELRSEDWIDRQKRKIDRGLDALETEAEAETLAAPDGQLTIGEISIGCALAYLDLRFDADDWRHNRPALASWFEDLAERPSFRDTAPPTT